MREALPCSASRTPHERNYFMTKLTPLEFAEHLRRAAAELRAAHKNDRARALLLMAAAIEGFADKLL